MGVARGLELARRAVYRGRLKRLAVDRRLDVRLGEWYWAAYRIAAGNEHAVRVGEATATFSVSTYAEHHVVSAVQGAERPVVARLLEALDGDDVFWDVGANVGTFSCLAGDLLETGTVVAIEPYPANVERLRQNLGTNDVDAIVGTCALSSAPADGTLLVLDTERAGTLRGTIETTHASVDDAVGTVGVDVTTGDRLVASGDVPPPNVVKIDVEGAAPEVLDGMADTIRRPDCRLVVVEPHGNRAEIERRLLGAGFHVDEVRLSEHRSEESPTIVATTPDSPRGTVG